MKNLLFVLGILFATMSHGQGFIEGDPRGSIWLSDGIVTIKLLNTSDELGLWRAELSEWSPTKEAATWIFADDFVLIEPPNAKAEGLPHLKLKYTYSKETKTLSLSRMASDSPDWIYGVGITSSGGFVLMLKKDEASTSN